MGLGLWSLIVPRVRTDHGLQPLPGPCPLAAGTEAAYTVWGEKTKTNVKIRFYRAEYECLKPW